MEYNAPSGKLDFQRIINVRAAAPTANTYLPGIDTGEVTGSVNMNTPANNTPPANTLTIAYSMPTPCIKPTMRDTTNTVMMYVTVKR